MRCPGSFATRYLLGPRASGGSAAHLAEEADAREAVGLLEPRHGEEEPVRLLAGQPHARLLEEAQLLDDIGQARVLVVKVGGEERVRGLLPRVVLRRRCRGLPRDGARG